MPAIKYYRVRAGLMQSELADRLHVTRQLVSMWETGRALPSTPLLPALAAVFGCTIDDLFKGFAAA